MRCFEDLPEGIMNKTLLKIGLIILPVFIYWFSGWAFVSMMIFLSLPTIPFGHEMESISMSRSYQLPYFGSYVVLSLSIYLSITLWIKYVKNVK
jgi:hypothetical protein